MAALKLKHAHLSFDLLDNIVEQQSTEPNDFAVVWNEFLLSIGCCCPAKLQLCALNTYLVGNEERRIGADRWVKPNRWGEDAN